MNAAPQAIPPDVKEKARAVVERICPYFHVEQKRTFIAEKWPVVAQAIMAERRASHAQGNTVAVSPAPYGAPLRGDVRLGLTRQQKALLDYLKRYSAEEGVMPSHDEMKDAVGLESKGGVNRLLKGLEERGHIRRLPRRFRAIEVLG